MALQHVYSNNNVFVWLMDMANPLLCGLTVCIRALHLPWKGKQQITITNSEAMVLYGVAGALLQLIFY